MLGYLFYLAMRIWGASFNYIFMSNSLNIVGMCVGVVASLFLYVNDIRSPIITSQPLANDSADEVDSRSDGSGDDAEGVAEPSSAASESTASESSSSGVISSVSSGSPRVPGLVATGVAFGALVFLTSFLFAEASIICRWCVAPYPFPGPQPHPWG